MVQADEDFHNVIYRAADNPKLETIVKNLREQMYRYRYEYIKDHTDYKQLVREHAAIIAGFERHDVAYVRRRCTPIWKIRSRPCGWPSGNRSSGALARETKFFKSGSASGNIYNRIWLQ